jgi:hypothetical protein
MGHLPPNHDVGRVMASVHTQNVFLHLMGCLSINVVLVIVLDVGDFLVHEGDVFVHVLGVPLKEMLCSCPTDRLQSRSEDVSL